MASATPTRLLADKLIRNGIDSFIQDRRAERKSWRRIALDLRDQTNGVIDVTPETVRKWATSLQAVA